MKHLTRKKAIELCIELWEWCAKAGKKKKGWPGWDKYYDKYGSAQCDCWFCEYNEQQIKKYNRDWVEVECGYCPLKKLLEGRSCLSNECAYSRWERAETNRTRKKYAALFVEQLKTTK